MLTVARNPTQQVSTAGRWPESQNLRWPEKKKTHILKLYGSSVAFCSPAKSLTFSGLVESPLVGKKLKS